jgi:excisionase family DNA binding protein
MINGYLTTNEAARVLGVSDARVRQLILDRRIPAVKVGNTLVIKQSALERFQHKRNGRRRHDAA